MRTGFRVLVLAAVTCAGAMVVGAPTAQASHSCADAVPMVPGSSQMGSATVQGTIGTFEPSDWWRHTGTPAPRTITVAADNEVDLYVHAPCGTPICQSTQNGSDSCTVAPSGDIFIEVRLRLPATFANYTLTVAPPPPTQCSDGIDNDDDGAVDFGNDPHCTSLSDPTEAAIRSAVWGGVMWGTDTTESPQTITILRNGVFATHYVCGVQNAPLTVVCAPRPDPDIQWVCSTMPLIAEAPSRLGGTTQVGNVSGTLRCDNPATIKTDDVVARGTAWTSNTQEDVDLGTANQVRCGSAGILGGANAEGSFSVTCGPMDPGLEWPYGEPPAPGLHGDTIVEVVTL